MAFADTSLITHGTGNAGSSLSDLTGLFLTSMTISGSRTETLTPNSDGTTVRADYSDPINEITHEGTIDSAGGPPTGWAQYHPGQAVTPHANITALGGTEGFFCFNPSLGVHVYLDPSRTYTRNEDTTQSFTLKHLPNIT